MWHFALKSKREPPDARALRWQQVLDSEESVWYWHAPGSGIFYDGGVVCDAPSKVRCACGAGGCLTVTRTLIPTPALPLPRTPTPSLTLRLTLARTPTKVHMLLRLLRAWAAAPAELRAGAPAVDKAVARLMGRMGEADLAGVLARVNLTASGVGDCARARLDHCMFGWFLMDRWVRVWVRVGVRVGVGVRVWGRIMVRARLAPDG